MSDADFRVVFLHDEMRRRIDRQQETLDEMRSRAGTILAAASISASFLGASTIEDDIGVWGWIGTAAFVAVGIAACVVLSPWRGWKFSRSYDKVLSSYVNNDDMKSETDLLYESSRHLNGYISSNKRRSDVMSGLLAFSAAMTVVEVCAFLIELGGSS